MSVDYVTLIITKAPDYVLAGAAFLTVRYQLREIHKTMNSRLDELVKASRAQGRQEERDSHSITVAGVPEV